MIEVGRKENKVIIFDNKDLVQMDIIRQKDIGAQVRFKLQNIEANSRDSWQFMAIERSKNPDMCESLDHFYKEAYALVQEQRDLYQKECPFETNRGIYRKHYWKSHQITYPCDTMDHLKASMIGVSKCQDVGYGLGYLRSIKEMKERLDVIEVLLKEKEGHYPELASLYLKLFEAFSYCTNNSYEACEKHFQEAVLVKRS